MIAHAHRLEEPDDTPNSRVFVTKSFNKCDCIQQEIENSGKNWQLLAEPIQSPQPGLEIIAECEDSYLGWTWLEEDNWVTTEMPKSEFSQYIEIFRTRQKNQLPSQEQVQQAISQDCRKTRRHVLALIGTVIAAGAGAAAITYTIAHRRK